MVPGAASMPDDDGLPSGMFVLPIDTTQARLELTLRHARSVLPAVPLFSEIDPKSLDELLQKSRLLQLSSGDVVFRQGDPPESLYVVVNGRVVLIDEAAPPTELYHLGENEFFGEAALISNEPRSATVAASEPCDLLAFDREAMSGCIADNPDIVLVLLRFLRERMVEHLVRTSPLFTGFQTAERRALSKRFEFIQLEQGAQLIRQGTRSPGLFVMLSGAVDVVRNEAGMETRLATLERGGVFGEMSLLAQSGAVADVRGARAGFVLMLPAESFREVIMTHPQFLEVVTLLCEERRVGLAQAI